jgi:hypothetical protein
VLARVKFSRRGATLPGKLFLGLTEGQAVGRFLVGDAPAGDSQFDIGCEGAAVEQVVGRCLSVIAFL